MEAEKRLWAARGVPAIADAIAAGFAAGGYPEAMRRAADTVAARPGAFNVNAMGVARLYLRAGRTDEALFWLERAYEERDPNLPYISAGHREFEALRADPRFQGLLRRMKLPA